MKDGKIFLGGGGDDHQSFLIEESFVENTAPGNILYIPIAMVPEDGDYSSCLSWFTNNMQNHGVAADRISMWTDLSNKKEEDFCSFSGIYIGGGMTGRLCRLLRNSAFMGALPKFLARRGSLFGGSAGAIVFGATLLAIPEEIEAAEKDGTLGLGIFSLLSIRCHFDPSDKAVIRTIRKAQEMGAQRIIGIPESTGLVSGTNNLIVVGAQPIYYFNGNEKSIIQPGEKLAINI